MNNQVQKPKNPLAHPRDEFITWYGNLSLDQKLRISVDLLYADPQFNTTFDGDTMDAPVKYLQAHTSNDYELLARIGTLKTLIDVFLYVPSETQDVSAFYLALYASMLIKAKAAGLAEDDPVLLAAKSAYGHAKEMREDYDNLYTLWQDFSVGNGKDPAGNTAPFSRRYLYRWICQEEGRHDPFVAGD